MSARLASAPVTWGVWEQTSGRDDLVAPEAMLEAVQALGYTGIELGPPGYFGADGAAVGEALSRHGLELVGGFAPLDLVDEEGYRRDVGLWLDPILEALAATGARGPVVLAGSETPERSAAAGRPAELARTALSRDAFARAVDRLERAAERCRARGVGAVFHHHTGTHVESPDEIALLLELSDLDVCYDTGHAAVGGGDPVEVARLCGERIRHLHLKDVAGGELERLRRGEVSLSEAWANGIFCPFGEGIVDLAAVLALPELAGFDGWVVLEQDRVTADFAAVREVEAANLALVRAAL